MDPRGFGERLTGEVQAWLQDGVVDAKTARRILARYGEPLPAELAAHGRRRGGGIMSGLGAALTGLGVLLFVASNWVQLGHVERLAILLVALGGSYGLSHVLRGRGMRRTAAALVAVGTMAFGASVYLVGQTYHLAIGDPFLPFLWSAGALAMAFTVTSRPSFVVGVAALALGYGTVLARWDAWQDPPFIALGALVWGMAAVALAVLASRTPGTRPFFGPLIAIGAVVVLVVVIALSFGGLWDSLGRDRLVPNAGLRTTVGLAAVVLIAALALLVRSSALSRRESLFFAGAAAAVVAVPSALLVLHPFGTSTPYAIVMNTLILLTVLVSAYYGIRSDRESFVNVGLVLFGITVFCRYFDLAFGLLDRSLVFVGAGLLLLALGFGLERGRRRLLARPVEAAGVA